MLVKLAAFFVLPATLLAAPASDLEKVVEDYVGLYRRETLPEWKKLFLPHFTVASTGEDGSVSERTLEEFYDAQRSYLDGGRDIQEQLENVRIDRQGKLASVWADFVLTDEGETRRGKLVLLLIQGPEGFKIHSLMFSYYG
ncbi:MAG TPA: nuclear transport factor 2 family protein [Vicinamibacteria bacterium]|nr:nuclear transport factor 2 family protein [Vicinamibacteria bacterium]